MANPDKLAAARSRNTTKLRQAGRIRDPDDLFVDDKPIVSKVRNAEGRFEVNLPPRKPAGSTGN